MRKQKKVTGNEKCENRIKMKDREVEKFSERPRDGDTEEERQRWRENLRGRPPITETPRGAQSEGRGGNFPESPD